MLKDIFFPYTNNKLDNLFLVKKELINRALQEKNGPIKRIKDISQVTERAVCSSISSKEDHIVRQCTLFRGRPSFNDDGADHFRTF